MSQVTAIALLLAGTAAFGSPSDPCSVISVVKDARVAIAIADGRTSFREGEIIPLVLSFTSTADKRYWAYNRNYDRSGRLNIETYCVEPAMRDPLADYFGASAGFMGGGLGSEQQLSEKPFTATAELNEWRQPVPGHYRLYIVSERVWRPRDPDEATPYGMVTVPLRSNTIEFDVIRADASWLAMQLNEATAAYQNAPPGQERLAARRLRFLNTKQSAETLAKLFWGLNDQAGGLDLMFGLFGSPYRQQAIATMLREISRPDHPITPDFLRTLAKLEICADSSWYPPADSAPTNAFQEYWQKRQARERELMKAAIDATAAAAPQKKGRARALTIQALAESSDPLNAAAVSQMRKQLVAVWVDLPEKIRLELIQYHWPQIAGPEMLPILKTFVSSPAPQPRTMEAMARDAALEHIYQLDAVEGRSLILHDLRDPKAAPSISLIKLLSADELRPIVLEALERVERNEARELDYHLIERLGDESALGTVKTVFNGHIGQWGCDPQSAMLRYLLRLDPKFGAKMVEASLAQRKSTGCYRMLLQDMGKLLFKVEHVAIDALDDADLEVANDAALALGRWGTAKAETALWARLKRFHQEWQGRDGQLRMLPDYRSATTRATVLEETLVNAIATGTSWICGPDKLDRLGELASPQQRLRVAAWRKEWEGATALITPNWFSADEVNFGVLQYSNLDEDQFRNKLSQMPRGLKLYFQVWKSGQIFPAVSIEKQEAVFASLRSYAAQFGVPISERGEP